MPALSRRALLASAPALLLRTSEPVHTPAQLAAAAKLAKPGETILLADGTWADTDLAFEAHGAEGKPVTVRAATTGKVILTGQSRLRFAGEWIAVEGLLYRDCQTTKDLIDFRLTAGNHARHSRLSHCAVVDCSPLNGEVVTRWISIYGSGNEVSRCYVEGKRNSGPSMVVWLNGEPNRHVIRRNRFGPRPPLGRNGGETIRVGDSSTSMQDSRTLVTANWFDRCDGETEVISNKSCGNEYRGNLFESCQGTLTLRHGNRCQVEGNIFLGHGVKNTGGIRVIGEDHVVDGNYLEGLRGTGFRAAVAVINGLPNSPLNGYYQVKHARVRNNTMVDCTEGVRVGINGGNSKLVLAPLDILVEGNRELSAANRGSARAPAFDRTSTGPAWHSGGWQR